MDDFVSLAQLAAELGLDRMRLRDCVFRSGVRPRKIRVGRAGNGVALVITEQEAARFRAFHEYVAGRPVPPGRAGYFLAVQLVPDLDPRRLKLGFTLDLRAWSVHFRVAAPTAVVAGCWRCRENWVATVIDCVSARGCSAIADSVFNCDDVPELVARANALFGLLPMSAQSVAPSPSLDTTRQPTPVSADDSGRAWNPVTDSVPVPEPRTARD
ncbi:MAG TPA: hypothetical protein VKD90_15495 [Gemmataceae bacterium]|nr:hypothetical protein [Gemmataceae bacterium]